MAYWHFIDLTGLIVNKLTVIRLSIGGNGIPLQWECKCVCGKTCIIAGYRLRNWQARSCGCVKRTSANFIDLTGQKFGLLKATSVHSRKNGKIKWNCTCDCGKLATVVGSKLKSGRTKSCGCLRALGSRKAVKDLTGLKFNKLTVLSMYGKLNKSIAWSCICECGSKTVVRTSHLKGGYIKSCGCLGKYNGRKHGLSDTKLAHALTNMKARCYNPKDTAYKNYGGRGITICEEWRNSSESFYNWALQNGYEEHLTIERDNVNLGYEPLNCRWATQLEQARNTRKSLGVVKVLEIKGLINQGLTNREIATKYNVDISTIYYIKVKKNYRDVA